MPSKGKKNRPADFPLHHPNRAHEIDLALAVMCALQREGECIPCATIAEVTGMSYAGPIFITQTALKKVRFRLRQLGLRPTGIMR